jgi:nicotinamide-nucleotide amidase
MILSTVEVISIGSELTLGQITDTNAVYLSRRLSELGLDVVRRTTVADDLTVITQVLDEAAARARVVITSGGLGPTADDLTRDAIAAATGQPLEIRPALREHIEGFFRRIGRTMPTNNLRQAELPAGAEIIPNPVGTAAGFAMRHRGTLLIALPGVPRELVHLFETTATRLIEDHVGIQTGMLALRVLHTVALGESALDQRLADLALPQGVTLGTLAHDGQVDVRLTARAESSAAANELLAGSEREVRQRLADAIFGSDGIRLEDLVGSALAARDWSIAMIEVHTGGTLATRMTATPATAERLRQAWVLPTTALPRWLRTRSGEIIDPASERAALTLAAAAARRAGCAVGLAVLGETEPGIGPHGHRPGRGAIGLILPGTSLVQPLSAAGTSEIARRWACSTALWLLLRCLDPQLHHERTP